MKKLLINALMITVLFTVLMFSAIGDEYSRFGGDNFGTFNIDGYGAWNTATATDLDKSSKFIDNQEFLVSSKVATLDDGEKYIISYSSGNIVLYEYDSDTANLNLVDGYNIESGVLELDSDILVQEISGKNYILFMLRSSTCGAFNRCPMYLGKLTYNGTDFNFTTLYARATDEIGDRGKKYYDDGTSEKNSFLSCTTEYCVAVYQSSFGGDSTSGGVYVSYMDLNAVRDGFTFDLSFRSINETDACIYTPIGANIALGNIDNDFINGDPYDYDDAVFSIGGYAGGVKAKVISINLNDTEIVSTDWIYSETLPNPSLNTGNCDAYSDPDNTGANGGVFLSGVTAFNYDGLSSNGLEIFVGVITSDINNYLIRELSSTGSNNDRHPDTFNLEGQLVSNPLVLDCYSDSGTTDLGAVTYDYDTDKIKLLCSCATCSGNDDCEYEGFLETNFNISTITNLGKSVFSFEADGSSGDELLTPFGVFNINRPSFVAGVCVNNEIQKIYNINERDSIVTPIDYEGNGRLDLLFTSTTSLSYLDDGFENKKPYIDSLTFEPCAGVETLKLDTDLIIKVESYDDESDLVSYNIITYVNTVYENESGWSAFQDPTTQYLYNTVLNETIGVGYIEVRVKDSQHTDYNTIERVFSVDNDNSSASFGDCVYTSTDDELLGEQDTGEEYIPTTSASYQDADGNFVNDNTVKNTANTVGAMFGLGGALVYFGFMIVVSVAIWISSSKHGVETIGMVLLANVGMVILGVKLELISLGTLIVIVLPMIIIVGMMIRNVIMSNGTSD